MPEEKDDEKLTAKDILEMDGLRSIMILTGEEPVRKLPWMPFTAYLEDLSAAVHELWMEWSMNVAEEVTDETLQRWKKNWCDYKELPEEEKEKDRKIARKLLKIAIGAEHDKTN